MAEERELTREEKIAAAKAKVEAMKAARAAAQATGQAPAVPGAPAAPETPISAANVAGRPAERVTGRRVRAYGTVSQAVDIVCAPEDQENLRKLLTGISGYVNPLRKGAFQVDYRYYAEARRRLEQAGYQVEESDFMGRPVKDWSPLARGWTMIEG